MTDHASARPRKTQGERRCLRGFLGGYVEDDPLESEGAEHRGAERAAAAPAVREMRLREAVHSGILAL